MKILQAVALSSLVLVTACDPSSISIMRDAEAAVKARLKDPDSAVFSNMRIRGETYDPTVCGSYNAKNGFGGYVGETTFIWIQNGRSLTFGTDGMALGVGIMCE